MLALAFLLRGSVLFLGTFLVGEYIRRAFFGDVRQLSGTSWQSFR